MREVFLDSRGGEIRADVLHGAQRKEGGNNPGTGEILQNCSFRIRGETVKCGSRIQGGTHGNSQWKGIGGEFPEVQ